MCHVPCRLVVVVLLHCRCCCVICLLCRRWVTLLMSTLVDISFRSPCVPCSSVGPSSLVLSISLSSCLCKLPKQTGLIFYYALLVIGGQSPPAAPPCRNWKRPSYCGPPGHCGYSSSYSCSPPRLCRVCGVWGYCETFHISDVTLSNISLRVQ